MAAIIDALADIVWLVLVLTILACFVVICLALLWRYYERAK